MVAVDYDQFSLKSPNPSHRKKKKRLPFPCLSSIRFLAKYPELGELFRWPFLVRCRFLSPTDIHQSKTLKANQLLKLNFIPVCIRCSQHALNPLLNWYIKKCSNIKHVQRHLNFFHMNEPETHNIEEEKKALNKNRTKILSIHPPLAIILAKSQLHREGNRHGGSLHIPDMI